jgi:hypothetical protein
VGKRVRRAAATMRPLPRRDRRVSGIADQEFTARPRESHQRTMIMCSVIAPVRDASLKK